MSNIRFKIIVISTIIIFFTFTIIGVKYRQIGRSLLALNKSKYYYGDLYEFSSLWRFKDHIYVDNSTWNNVDINEADIITMGDSFFEDNFETPIVAAELSRITGKKVHHVIRSEFEAANDNPLAYLNKIGYVKGEKKYLVLETLESYALDRSTRYQLADFITRQAGSSKNIIATRTDKIRKFIEPINLQYFFYNNKIIYPFYSLGKNFRFEVLNEIDKRTPKYSTNPYMLFYVEEINFNNEKIPLDNIEMMANNVKILRNALKEKYNIELIYYIQPTKYSIYGKYTETSDQYNNFIPKAFDSLKKYDINTFDVYSEYCNLENIEKDLLYYKGDTHFTPRGKNVVIEDILKLIK